MPHIPSFNPGPARTPPLTPRARRLRSQRLLLLAAASALVILAHVLGLFAPLERIALDARSTALPLQRKQPIDPADRPVILAIDDFALTAIGPWPWPRSTLAQIIDEIALAKPSVIALDIFFEYPSAAWLSPDTAPEIAHAEDQRLAESLAAAGNAVAAVNFSLADASQRPPGPQPLPLVQRFTRILQSQPDLATLPDDQLVNLLIQHHSFPESTRDPDPRTRAELRRAIDQALTLLHLRTTSAVPLSPPPADHAAPAHRITADDPQPPIPAIATALHAVGFANYASTDPDGVLRTIPLHARLDDHLWPAFSLAVAAHHRRQSLADFAAACPAPAAHPFPSSAAQPFHRITFPRAQAHWLGQFTGKPSAAPSDAALPSELSLTVLAEPHRLLDAARRNIAQADALLAFAFSRHLVADDAYAARSAQLATLDLTTPAAAELLAAQRITWNRATSEAASELDFRAADLPALRESDPELVHNLTTLARSLPSLAQTIDHAVLSAIRRRTLLRHTLADRPVFLGWTASGSVADFIPTPVHPRTPGVYVHAAVTQSLLAGPIVSDAHPLLPITFILLFSALGYLAATRPSVLAAIPLTTLAILLSLAAAALAYTRAHLMLPVVAPAIAAPTVAAAVLLHRLFTEQLARRRTEQRFRSYLAPAVVDILVEHPELDAMRPQQRNLTVLFLDIAGFTPLSSSIGSEHTARLLHTFFSAVTPILHDAHATLDKYLGDGLMAFFGAPVDDPDHPKHACAAALRITQRLHQLNASNAFNLPQPLRIRIGISTGDLLVGDFGNPPQNSAYTVLGDAAITASRLQSANRSLGTTILISHHTAAALPPDFLTRPLGLFLLPGRADPEPVFQLLDRAPSPHTRADPAPDPLTPALAAFASGDVNRARDLFTALRDHPDHQTLTRFYLRTIEHTLSLPPDTRPTPPTITLTDK